MNNQFILSFSQINLLLSISTLLSLQFSCKNQILEKIAHQGEVLADSVMIYNELSDKYLSEIQMSQMDTSAYANFVYTSLQNHNYLMDSVIDLLTEKAVNLNDRKVSTKYLVKEGHADHIRQEINERILEIEDFSELELPERAKLILWRINDGMEDAATDWASSKFKNMPFALSKTTLRQWQLNNSKACALILLDLRERMAQNSIIN
ncbi:MAG: hypothetical protein AAFP82_02900 [Bacteroidota bacterium]